ncbi:MAG: DegT/DnrJ/EryC1/StrS family aminotransferase [Pseudomonadota bacterium]
MALYSIPYVQVNKQYEEEKEGLEAVISDVLANRSHVGDKIVDELEEELAAYCGTKYAVALNSGTDALMFSMLAAGIKRGDEVVTPPNSFVASTSSIIHIGGKPIFADVLPDQNIDPDAVEAAITERTKAIMAVHLTGRVCQMDRLQKLADKHNLLIIEDAAQSIGSKYNNKKSGSFGIAGCFSTHPLKNLNACGDGGFITTDNEKIASRVRLLRAHGMKDRVTVEEWGFVSRMDTMQAAILKFRLGRMQSVIDRRRANAKYYQENLKHTGIFFPDCKGEEYNTFHTFVIQVENHRDALQEHLAKLGIKTTIHYPIPIHLQPAAKSLGHNIGDFPITENQAKNILTLPVNQYMARADQDVIIKETLAFMDNV